MLHLTGGEAVRQRPGAQVINVEAVTATRQRAQRVDRQPSVETAGQTINVVHHRVEALHRHEHDRRQLHFPVTATLPGRQVDAALRGDPCTLERRVTAASILSNCHPVALAEEAALLDEGPTHLASARRQMMDHLRELDLPAVTAALQRFACDTPDTDPQQEVRRDSSPSRA